MRTQLIAIAALVGGSLTLNAQTPQTPQTPPQQQQRPTETGDTTERAGQKAGAQTITVQGCLKAEKDVAGRRANTAERAGVGNNFVLTNVKMAQASATSGIGLATMYELDGLPEAELQKHINHQIEVMGSLSTGNEMGNRGASAAGATGATGAAGATGEKTGAAGARQGNQAAANADLPELRATSIKMISATCAAQ